MPVNFERIATTASPEAIFQSLRRWSLTAGEKIDASPLYDFGHLLNVDSAEFIGPEPFLDSAKLWNDLATQVGFQLPHPVCAFLLRYARTRTTPPFMLLAIGRLEDTASDRVCTVRWYQWDESRQWIRMASAHAKGGLLTFRMNDPALPESDVKHYRNTYMTALSAALYLIYGRSDAVNTVPRAPGITKGRSKVHPLAPSSIITLRINRERLAQAPALTEPQAGGDKRSVTPHNRAGSMPFYKHPRYKNVRFTRRPRAGAAVHGGSEATKTYRVTT